MRTNRKQPETCPNCGARITCGCQRRIAIDGVTRGCSKCISRINADLRYERKYPQVNKRNIKI